MIKTFTQADLIRYLYHETTEKEEQEINKALLTDPNLKNQYTYLRTLKSELDGAQLQPSDSTVQNILKHARSTTVLRS